MTSLLNKQIVVWNALEIVKIEHRSYLYSLKKYGIVKRSLQAHFEVEFHCLNECLVLSDLSLDCELNTNSFEDPSLGLQTPK
jgi:hypothetical protein